MHRPPLPPGNIPGTHFCQRLSRPQGHSAAGRVMSMKNSNDTIGNRTRDLPTCSSMPEPTALPRVPAKLINPLNAELNPICYLLALLRAHHFLHISKIRVKSLILRLLMSYIYGAPILDVSRSNTTTHRSRQYSSGRVISSSQRPLPDDTTLTTNVHAPPVGFEPTILAGDRPQTYALDRAANGIELEAT